jgi:Uma2 family endonuclease
MADPAARLMTYEDLLARDETSGARPELIDGRIVYKASPRGPHSRAQARVAGRVLRFDRDDEDGWWILTEPDVLLRTDRVARPDVAGWRRARMPVVPNGAIELPPDWVCEILSPNHEAHDRKTKRDLYREHDVRWYWLLDPEARTLEAFELRDRAWVLLGTWTDGDQVRVPPFEPMELDVGDLFLPLPK